MAPAGTPPKQRSRTAVVVALVMMLAGAAVYAFLAWEYLGTNIVAHRQQEQAVGQLRADWKGGGRPAALRLGDAFGIVRIPEFGDDYAVPLYQGVSDDVLARGFGHFPRSAPPGGVGNFALAAHRVTHGEPLRDMPDLRPDDQVIIETRKATYTYELDTDPSDLVVPFTSTWVTEPAPENPDPTGVSSRHARFDRLITLTTCAELFHTDNRMIAFGHLVAVDRR